MRFGYITASTFIQTNFSTFFYQPSTLDYEQHPGLENVRVVRDMPTPSDLLKLRSFLETINHYSSIVSVVHDPPTSLNDLAGRITGDADQRCQDL